MRTPTDRDEALLLAAQERLPHFIAQAHQACHWLLETTDAAKAQLWLVKLDLALPAVSKLFATEELPPDEQREWLFPVTALLGEYLIQQFRAAWVVDDAPTSHSFARPIVQWQHHAAEIHRLDVMGRAVDFLAQPAPRDLAALVTDDASGEH